MPTHPKPQLLVLLFVFWVVFCLFLFVLLFVFVWLVFFNPLYIPINLYLTKKLRDQCKFFFCSGMLVMLKYRQTVMARSDTPPSLFSKLRCYQCDFFLCYAPFNFSGITTFFNISKIIARLKCPGARSSHPQETSV